MDQGGEARLWDRGAESEHEGGSISEPREALRLINIPHIFVLRFIYRNMDVSALKERETLGIFCQSRKDLYTRIYYFKVA